MEYFCPTFLLLANQEELEKLWIREELIGQKTMDRVISTANSRMTACP
jgi:hypothetical protein